MGCALVTCGLSYSQRTGQIAAKVQTHFMTNGCIAMLLWGSLLSHSRPRLGLLDRPDIPSK